MMKEYKETYKNFDIYWVEDEPQLGCLDGCFELISKNSTYYVYSKKIEEAKKIIDTLEARGVRQ